MLELAYIAGFFDGEGYITVSHWKNAKKMNPLFSAQYVRYQLVIGIGNTHKPVIHQIKAEIGGDVHANDSAQRRDGKSRVCYDWRLTSGRAAEFLERVLPYLVVKREEAVLAIELQKHLEANKNVVRYQPDKAEGIYSYRQSLTDQIRALKKRRYDTPVGSDPQLSA